MNCAICQAPLPLASAACPYAVSEPAAPWRGDYAAMHRGDMTHAQHVVHVARWSLHHAASQSEKSLARFGSVARAHAGEPAVIFPYGDGFE